REAFSGARRFEEFHTALDIPRAVLASRLERLCDEGLLDKVEYQAHPPRSEYRLTQKGREFWSVLAAMWRWGSDWLWTDGDRAPVVLMDRESGEVVVPSVVDERTGVPIDVRDVRVGRDPAAQPSSDPGRVTRS
ncbi:MAG: winged helix-turn-helix transcriptional regulator, partial [Ilumatobacteraceae bacterium]